jgi:hypothetical protein
MSRWRSRQPLSNGSARRSCGTSYSGGLAHTDRWRIDESIPDRPHLVHLLVDPELLQQVQDAADAHGASVAVWLRQAMRQMTLEDFPASWRAGDMTSRSHASGYDDRTCGLRLDEVTSRTLETLTQTFDRSATEMIHQVMAQATPEDVPQSWHMAVIEPQRQEARPGGGQVRGVS